LERLAQSLPKAAVDAAAAVRASASGLAVDWSAYLKMVDVRLTVPTDLGLATQVPFLKTFSTFFPNLT